MCRWKVLVVLFVLSKHNSSHPLPDDILDRPPRQLNFEECCPCGDNTDVNNNSNDDFMDAGDAGSKILFSRPRDMDDCPCRFRNSDSQGASSILFPSTMDYTGNLLRSSDKKENLKPIFNPEVDLAASVLETIKEVTDKEYEEALARDAAKTATKEAVDFLYGDTTPEESANIISAVVEPVFGDEDIISEEPHIQQSRCIHPIENTKYNSDNMQFSPKLSSLFNKPKLLKPKSHFLRKKPLDMDNSLGASNIYEQIVPVGLDPEDLDIIPTKAKTNTDTGNFDSDIASDTGEYCKVNKISDFRSVHVQNQLKASTSRPSLEQSLNDNTNLLNKRPKFKLSEWLRENNELNNAKQDTVVPTTYELIEKKAPYLKNDFQNLNVKEKNSPLSLKNLLNLRDVELIPLKELFQKQIKIHENKKAKLLQPSSSNHDSLEMTTRNEATEDNNNFDLKENLSVVNNQENSNNIRITDDCEEEMSELKSITNDLYPETKVVSRGLENRPFDSRNDMQDLDNDCIEYNNKDQTDSLIDGSNYVSKTIEKLETFCESLEETPHKSHDQYKESQSSTPISEIKQFNLNSIDVAVSSMRDKLAEKLKELKSFGTSTKNKNIMEQEIYNSDLDNKQISVPRNENQAEECLNNDIVYTTKPNPDMLISRFDDTTMVIPNLRVNDLEDCITTLKSNALGDNVGDSSNNEAITELTMEDLQKQSDALLQEENNKSNPKECLNQDDDIIFETSEGIDIDPTVWIDDPTVMNVDNSDTLEDTITEPDISDSFNEVNDAQNPFLGNLDDSKISQLILVGTEPDDVIMNAIPKEADVNDVITQPIQVNGVLSDIGDVLNLPPVKPLPALDDLKIKLANLLPNNGRGAINLRLGNSDNLQEGNLKDSEKSSDFQEKSTEGENYLSNSVISETDPIAVDASEFIRDTTPQEYDILSSQVPLQPQLDFLKESMSNLSDILNISPTISLPALDNIKEKIIYSFENSGLNLDKANTVQTQNVLELEEFGNIKNNEENRKDQKDMLLLLNPIDMSSEGNDIIINTVPRDVDAVKSASMLQPQLSSFPLKPSILDNSNIKDDELNLNKFDTTKTKKNIENTIINTSKKKVFEENTKDLVVTNTSLSGPIDANVEASDIIMKLIPKHGKDIDSRSVLQPPIRFLGKPLLNLKSSVSPLKYFNTLPTVNDIKMGLLKSHQNNSKIPDLILPKILDLKQISDNSDLLNSDMPTDASSSNFQLKDPPLRITDNVESGIRPSKKSSVLRNIPQLNQYSYKNKLPLQKEFKLKPTKIPSTLRDAGLLRNTRTNERSRQLTDGVLNLRSYNNIPRISKFNRDGIRRRITFSPDQVTDKGFSTLSNPKNLESRLRQTNDNMKLLQNTIYSPPSILDTISRHREEFNDKLSILESLHKNFNDKIDSARNNMLENSELFVSGPLIKKSKMSILPTSNSKLSAKSLFSHEIAEIKPVKRITLPRTESKKFRMPAGASVPIPKAIHVPELQTTSKKSRPMILRSTIPNWNTGLSQESKDSVSFGKQKNNLPNTNTFSQKKFSPKKETTVKVSSSVSTTPRSSMSTEQTFISPHLKDYNERQMDKLTTSGDTLKAKPNLSLWPKATTFLSKAKDDIQSRLSIESPVALKQSRIQPNLLKNSKNNFGTDMFRAASDIKNSIDESLKENISYKCHMVCGKN